jgi:hypothetical protein
MVVGGDKLRWVGGSLLLVNLAMLLVWGWAFLFALGLGFGGVLFAAGWRSDDIDLSNELPLFVLLVGVLSIFGSYFFFVFTNPEDIGSGLAQFIGAVILLIIIEVVTYSLVAADGSGVETDERDRAIKRAASRWGYGVLVVGVWVLIGQLVLDVVFEREALGNYLTANLLFLVFIAAELAELLARLLYYRLGISRA